MTVSELGLKELADNLQLGDSILSGNVDVIKNLKVKLNVELGEASLSVDELMDLKDGSVVKVDKEVNSSLDIYINDKLIARGVMVAVDDNFGVRITEINQ